MVQELRQLASELEQKPIVAIDIGTTKISVIIARASFDVDKYLSEEMITPNNLKLIINGIGVTPSYGMTEGGIYNIIKVSNSIRRAIDLAKTQLGIDSNNQFKSVLYSVAGVGLVKEEISQSISFDEPGHVITYDDLKRLYERAKNSATNSDNVLHIIPTEFHVRQGNRELSIRPIDNEIIGAVGDVLIGKFTLISIEQRNVKSLGQAIEQAGLKPDHVILQPLASTIATATNHEQEVGVLVIDIGGGTTDVLYMEDYRVEAVDSIDIAGNTIDNDLALIFKIPKKEARKIKEEFGSLIPSKKKQTVVVKVEGMGKDIKVSVNDLVGVMTARYYELFAKDVPMALSSLKNKGISHVVLTGGGSAVNGIELIARQAFQDAGVNGLFRNDVFVIKKGPDLWIDKKQSTVSFPPDPKSTSLIHSTAVGMLVYHIRELVADIVHGEKHKNNETEGNFMKSLSRLFRGWFGADADIDNDETF